MEARFGNARKRIRDAEAELVDKTRPILKKIAEQCAKFGILVRSDITGGPWDMEIEVLGVRSKEVSDFCNGALSEPVGGFYLSTHIGSCGAIYLSVRRECPKKITAIPAAVNLWSEILTDARTRAYAASVEIHNAARDLVDVLFVSAMPEDAASFEVVFDCFPRNSNLHIEAFLQLAARSAYWPSSYGYMKVLFAQTLDAFQCGIRETEWRVEVLERCGVYTIVATKLPQETQ